MSYQYRAPSRVQVGRLVGQQCSAEPKCPTVSPGTAVPSQIRCWSMPLCALFSVAAEPRKIVRASRRVSARCPNVVRSWSIRAGVDSAPSTSVSMIDFQESSRYWVRSSRTRRSPSGTVAGMISGVGVAGLPQRVDDGAHQPQHAAGALEPLQRRPVLVQPVEQLRMQRVSVPDPLLVLRLGDPRGELAPVLGIELGERARHRRDIGPGAPRRCPRTAAAARSRTTPAADAGRHWSAIRRTTFCSRSSASCPCVPPTSISERASAPHPRVSDDAGIDTTSSAPGNRGDRLGQRLGEGELGVEAARRPDRRPEQLPGVGDPLVDQDQARRVRRDQLGAAPPRDWCAVRSASAISKS